MAHMADQGAGEDEEIICQSTEGPPGSCVVER